MPPRCAMLPREVLLGDLVVDGGRYYVPAGTDVGVPTYALHHIEKCWARPTFILAQTLVQSNKRGGETKEIGIGHNNWEHRHTPPFGAGRTSCVGKYLAYQEMGIILARLFWLFDLRVAPGTHIGEGGKWWPGRFWERSWGRDREGEFQTRDAFTSSHDGPQVQFRLRRGWT